MRGTTPSEYNQLFTCGTAKEKHQLGHCKKYGPCLRWKTGKKVALIDHLETIAKEILDNTGSHFTFARDVLLPEVFNIPRTVEPPIKDTSVYYIKKLFRCTIPYSGNTCLPLKEDNLSIMDKMICPNVSVTCRFNARAF